MRLGERGWLGPTMQSFFALSKAMVERYVSGKRFLQLIAVRNGI